MGVIPRYIYAKVNFTGMVLKWAYQWKVLWNSIEQGALRHGLKGRAGHFGYGVHAKPE